MCRSAVNASWVMSTVAVRRRRNPSVTDHSKKLALANGMTGERLLAQLLAGNPARDAAAVAATGATTAIRPSASAR